MELRFPGRLALWRFAINSAAGKFLGADSVGRSRRLVSPERSAAENSGGGSAWGLVDKDGGIFWGKGRLRVQKNSPRRRGRVLFGTGGLRRKLTDRGFQGNARDGPSALRRKFCVGKSDWRVPVGLR